MYRHNSFRERSFRYSGWIINIGVLLSVILGIVLGVDVNDSSVQAWPLFVWILNAAREHMLLLYVVVGFLLVIGYFCKVFGTHRVWNKIQFILDEYQGKAFFDVDDDPEDHHRVTLFKLKKNVVFKRHWSSKKWAKPWGNTPWKCDYLVPVARSGIGSKRSKALFYIPDTSDNVEGVAGRAWFERRPVVLPELPDVNKSGALKRDKSNYAEVTSSSIEMIDAYRARNRKLPRAIAAMPIRVKGKRWGVIVLDSRRINGVKDESVLNYSLTLALLEQLLEDL